MWRAGGQLILSWGPWCCRPEWGQRKPFRADEPSEGSARQTALTSSLGTWEEPKAKFQERSLLLEGPSSTAELLQLSCPRGRGSQAPPPYCLLLMTLMSLRRRSLVRCPSVISLQHLQSHSGTSVSSGGIEGWRSAGALVLGIASKGFSRYLDHRLSRWGGT